MCVTAGVTLATFLAPSSEVCESTVSLSSIVARPHVLHLGRALSWLGINSSLDATREATPLSALMKPTDI